MDEYIKKYNKRYLGNKVTISVSVYKENVEFLDRMLEGTGLNRSEIICFLLGKGEELFEPFSNPKASLRSTAKMLGYKSPQEMKRRIERARKKILRGKKKRK